MDKVNRYREHVADCTVLGDVGSIPCTGAAVFEALPIACLQHGPATDIKTQDRSGVIQKVDEINRNKSERLSYLV